MRLQEARSLLHSTFVAVDEWLDAWAARHWPVLSALGYALSFVLLFGGVAYHVFETGLAERAVRHCGAPCSGIPGSALGAAALSGAAAILFMGLFAALAAAIQRTFFDPWQFVRPEPKPARLARWMMWIHVPLGLVLFFVISTLAIERPPGKIKVSISGYNSLALILGWWVGGAVVLKFFWLWARRRDGIEATK